MQRKNGFDRSMLHAVFTLAWPTMLEQLTQTAVQYIDTAMVGSLGTEATASVGATGTVNWMIGSIVSAVGVGFLAFISRQFGAGKPERARQASAQACMVTLVLGLLLTGVTLLAGPHVPVWMQVDPAIREQAARYFMILYLPMLFRTAKMIFGTVLMSVGVYFFKIPNGFSTGGVSGISTLLGTLTAVSAATWISIINVALLVVGFIFLGKSTGIRTVVCSLLFSGLTTLFEFLFPMKAPLTDEPFLELVYAMLLTAIGSAMIFFRRGSSGGTDIVALIIKKYFHINVGKALLCSDALIALGSFFVFGVRTGLFSLLGLFFKAFLVDGIIESLDSCKCFMIITSKPDEIIDYIIEELHHSATLVEAQGAYSHNNKFMVYTVCRRIEAIRLQREIKQVDPGAFVTITTASQIIGRGFRGV